MATPSHEAADGESGTDSSLSRQTLAGKRRAPGRTSRWEEPIALLIIRYFFYVLLAMAILLVGTYVFWFHAQGGSILYANYGERHIAKLGQQISRAETISDDMIPSAYWYRLYDQSGKPVGGDMKATMVPGADATMAAYLHDHSQDASASSAAGEQADESDGHTKAPKDSRAIDGSQPQPSQEDPNRSYQVFHTAGGQFCLLAYEPVPQWSSKQIRDRYPNPQTLTISLLLLAALVILLVIGLRAARLITRKLSAFEQVAASIGRQDLDAQLPRTNVREINHVLDSFAQMRDALKHSLESQWSAQEAQSRQVAALVHDLKTPLTIIQGNAELLGESKLDDGQKAYLAFIEDGAGELAQYAQAISHSSTRETKKPVLVSVARLSQTVEAQARGYLSTRSLALDIQRLPEELQGHVCGQEQDLARALMNIVANASDHSPAQGQVSISWSITPCELEAQSDTPFQTQQAGEGGPAYARRLRADQEDPFDGHDASCAEDHSQYVMLTITISDQGPGFSQEALTYGKEWLYQDDASRQHHDKHSGNHHGIGLSAASSIAEESGGSLHISNQAPGRGAQVTMKLPLTGGHRSESDHSHRRIPTTAPHTRMSSCRQICP
ncbi:HAMP domain-containing sensor histidine kinase [Bifidobacterium aemilianum]|nr:HAMP domain-containing sensor histidine kinase [Bifidobacterium aemilianum]